MILQLRQERIKRKWKLEQVAQKVGLTVSAIHDIETGRCKPSYEVLVKLEDLFHKNHRQLFAVVDEAPISQGNSTTNESSKSSH